MSYTLDIDIHEEIDEAACDIMYEMEEAVENIRKYQRGPVVHRAEVDIHDLLAEHRAIAIVWDVQHVRDQRPDLSDDEAWDVLQGVQHDRLNDPMLEAIRQEAETLYPRKRQARPTDAGKIVENYGNGDERGSLVYLLADLMHWCEGFGEPFEEFYGSARIHFEEESKSYKKGA